MKFPIELNNGIVVEFTWGPVVELHRVGPYLIVEYHPMIYKGCSGTGKYEKTRTAFHPYVNNVNTSESFFTLDDALAGAIAYRLEGINHRADIYFMAALEALAEKK